jgi:hypothetical protein
MVNMQIKVLFFNYYYYYFTFTFTAETSKASSSSSNHDSKIAGGVQWEFKWENKDDAKIHGPVSSEQMQVCVLCMYCVISSNFTGMGRNGLFQGRCVGAQDR